MKKIHVQLASNQFSMVVAEAFFQYSPARALLLLSFQICQFCHKCSNALESDEMSYYIYTPKL